MLWLSKNLYLLGQSLDSSRSELGGHKSISTSRTYHYYSFTPFP